MTDREREPPSLSPDAAPYASDPSPYAYVSPSRPNASSDLRNVGRIGDKSGKCIHVNCHGTTGSRDVLEEQGGPVRRDYSVDTGRWLD